jgi:hypothetical protein
MLDRPGEKNSNTIAPATTSLDMMLRFSSADIEVFPLGKGSE